VNAAGFRSNPAVACASPDQFALHAGEIFVEIALLDGQPRGADAIGVTDCELMVIERRDFLSFAHASRRSP